MFIIGIGTRGFVYCFEVDQTEGCITGRATLDLLFAERALEEDASFPIRETYVEYSVEDDVLDPSQDAVIVGGYRIPE